MPRAGRVQLFVQLKRAIRAQPWANPGRGWPRAVVYYMFYETTQGVYRMFQNQDNTGAAKGIEHHFIGAVGICIAKGI